MACAVGLLPQSPLAGTPACDGFNDYLEFRAYTDSAQYAGPSEPIPLDGLQIICGQLGLDFACDNGRLGMRV